MDSIFVVELNRYAPRPFVFTEAAVCLVASLRSMGLRVEHVHQGGQTGLMLVLGLFEPSDESLFPPKTTILLNFEILSSESVLVTREYRALLNRYRVIDYCEQNLHSRPISAPPADIWPVVPGPISPLENSTPRLCDVLFFGTMNGRRSEILNALQERGFQVERVAGAYGHELLPALSRARLVLNLHFYEAAIFPPLRVIGPYSLGLPIVMEHSILSKVNDWSDSGVCFSAYEELADTCEATLHKRPNPDELLEQRSRFRDRLQRTFETRARAFLASIF